MITINHNNIEVFIDDDLELASDFFSICQVVAYKLKAMPSAFEDTPLAALWKAVCDACEKLTEETLYNAEETFKHSLAVKKEGNLIIFPRPKKEH